MTRDQIEAWLASRLDALNRHDLVRGTGFYAPDCTVDSPTAGGTVRGLMAVDEVNRAWHVDEMARRDVERIRVLA